MSKAFTRESDDEPESLPVRPRSALPPGAKNYLTPDGAQRLRWQVERLVQVERIKLAANPADADTKRQLQIFDQRIAALEHTLESAIVVPVPPPPWEQVKFGASVTVRDRSGGEETYRIVGVEEMEVDRGWVSYLSPIARALMNAPLGGRVKFKFPSGESELEILRIEYSPAPPAP